MKQHLRALLKLEVDPMSFVLFCLVLASVLITAKAMTERVQTDYDYYAMDEPEVQFPAM